MDRSEKEALVQEYKEIFVNAPSGVLIDFQGLTVEQVTTLRKKLNEQHATMRVMKNSLAKIAAKGTHFEVLENDFVQSRAFVFSEEDPVAPAKIVADAAKDFEKLQLVSGALITGDKCDRLDAEGVKALGNMPSREELLVKLLFLMNAPATQFVRTINEVPAKFVRALSAIADSKN